MPIRRYFLSTSHGSLAVEEAGHGDLPLLLIHGNSSCCRVFRHQFEGPLAERHRLIAFDLPGHGNSSDAIDPQRSYTRPGLADAAAEVVEKLGLTELVVVGWSLGGHIAMELAPRLPAMRGLMIIGAPPVGRNTMALGFLPSAHLAAAGKPSLSAAEIDAFVEAIFGRSAEPFLREAVARTDRRFRPTLFEAARAGAGLDQRRIVEACPVKLAVVNGGADRFINLDYLDTIAYANLWDGRCHRLPGLGHAPFWEAPARFDPLLARFLADLDRTRS